MKVTVVAGEDEFLRTFITTKLYRSSAHETVKKSKFLEKPATLKPGETFVKKLMSNNTVDGHIYGSMCIMNIDEKTMNHLIMHLEDIGIDVEHLFVAMDFASKDVFMSKNGRSAVAKVTVREFSNVDVLKGYFLGYEEALK